MATSPPTPLVASMNLRCSAVETPRRSKGTDPVLSSKDCNSPGTVWTSPKQMSAHTSSLSPEGTTTSRLTLFGLGGEGSSPPHFFSGQVVTPCLGDPQREHLCSNLHLGPYVHFLLLLNSEQVAEVGFPPPPPEDAPSADVVPAFLLTRPVVSRALTEVA